MCRAGGTYLGTFAFVHITCSWPLGARPGGAATARRLPHVVRIVTHFASHARIGECVVERSPRARHCEKNEHIDQSSYSRSNFQERKAEKHDMVKKALFEEKSTFLSKK